MKLKDLLTKKIMIAASSILATISAATTTGVLVSKIKSKTDISKIELETNIWLSREKSDDLIVQKFIDINKEKLTGLNKDDFEILSNENQILTTKVKENNKAWFGQVAINFGIKTDISTIKLFKIFAIDNDQDQEIIDTFLRINNQFLQNDLTKDDLEIKKIPGRVDDSATATLKVKDSSNKKYKGKIEISYRIRKDININEGLKTELFCLDPNANEQTIKSSTKNLFFELNKEKIYPLAVFNLDVVNLNIEERKASIKIINSEEYKGQVEITLQDKLDISKISSLITTINKYSRSSANREIKDFFTANKDKLPLLSLRQLKKVEEESTKDKWVIEVKDSPYYQGKIIINLKQLTDISNNENIKSTIDLKDDKPFENNIIDAFYETNKNEFEKLNIKKENIKPSALSFKREDVTIQILGSEKYYASFEVKYKFNRIDINTLSSRITALNVRGKEEINEEVIKEAFAQQYGNFFVKYRSEFFGYFIPFGDALTEDDVKVIKIDDESVEVEILYENWFKNTLTLKLIK
ncbi:Hypothetical protein, predicted transmembrane protein [Mycoplasma yeatsii 13926]|uniref:Uncharacterized protein n=1 Tax=Mycoplasma yeatsii 13926 TaxID=1188240 RepID=S6G3X7_9MOLU|nr:hypothetical protein [Mycoplasma yeatsii]EOA07282.1 Hypothetical protein, predicted transmembrane protein [Mycoplasma yeatsii 13926]